MSPHPFSSYNAPLIWYKDTAVGGWIQISHPFRSRKEAAAGPLSLCTCVVFVSSLRLMWGHCGCPTAERKCHVNQQNIFKSNEPLTLMKVTLLLFTVLIPKRTKNSPKVDVVIFFISVTRPSTDSKAELERAQLHRVTGLLLKTLTAHHQELPLTGATDMLLAMRRALQRQCSLCSHQLSPWLRLVGLPQPDGKQDLGGGLISVLRLRHFWQQRISSHSVTGLHVFLRHDQSGDDKSSREKAVLQRGSAK